MATICYLAIMTNPARWVDIIDTHTFKVIESLGANGFVASLAVDPSRSRFVVASDHKLMVWDFVGKP